MMSPKVVQHIQQLQPGVRYKVEIGSDEFCIKFVAKFVAWTVSIFIPEEEGGDGNKRRTSYRKKRPPTDLELTELGYYYTHWDNSVVLEHSLFDIWARPQKAAQE